MTVADLANSSKIKSPLSPPKEASAHSPMSAFPPMTTQPLASDNRSKPYRGILKSPAHVDEDNANSPANAWRVVGSPPRRPSLLASHSPDADIGIDHEPMHHDERDDSVSELMSKQPKRSVRTRAASTPNPLMHESIDLNTDFENLKSATPPPATASQALQGMPGFHFGNSIWKGEHSSGTAASGLNRINPAGALDPYAANGRQVRSLSFSADSERRASVPYHTQHQPQQQRPQPSQQPYMPPHKTRARSHSSSAAYVINSEQEDHAQIGEIDNINIWSNGDGEGTTHRRSITSPSYTSWTGPQQLDPPMTPTTPTPEQIEQIYRANRRFSHAPTLFQDWNQLSTSNESPYPYPMPRRHSVAGPVLYSPDTMNPPTNYLTDALDQLTLQDEPVPSPFLDKIDDYFENTEQRTRAWVEAGRNLQMLNQTPHQWPLYVVEFKAGRTDFFYVPDDLKQTITRGDLVIVEADRGKDLGKVVVDDITTVAMLQVYQAQQAETIMDVHNNKDVNAKKIYRLAQPQEVAMLVQKSKDEMDAKEVASRKIKQKKMPMQIVDGEFQWDRRKLTFYFVSDRRIDFRELVRDLFKIYKTRIWMCQLSPNASAVQQQQQQQLQQQQLQQQQQLHLQHHQHQNQHQQQQQQQQQRSPYPLA